MASTIKKNLGFAFGAQGIQLLRSILVSLLIPKVLGIEEFGYWQLFIFYTQYGWYLYLGVHDGLYLKYGGTPYNKLDFQFLGFSLRLFVLYQFLVLLPFASCCFLVHSSERIIIILLSCLYIFINNIRAFFIFILRATNRIKVSSFVDALISILFITFVAILLIEQTNSFEPYIVAYLLAYTIGTIYISRTNHSIWRHFFCKEKNLYIADFMQCVRNGIVLLISSVLGSLIVGFGRFFVDLEWGIKTFAFISFSFMCVNFFMVFINQSSLVLFPELRRWDFERVNRFYEKIRKMLSAGLPLILLSYVPIILLIRLWLPKYENSIEYLLYLLPVCIFDIKTNLLFNTIFKVYNKIRELLYCNLIAFVCAVVLILLSVYYFHSLKLMMFSMIIAIGIRSILAEWKLNRFLFNGRWKLSGALGEIFMILIFVVLHIFFSYWLAWGLYLTACLFYCELLKITWKKK